MTQGARKLIPDGPISSPLLSDIAYQSIRDGMLSGKLGPDEWLRQEHIAQELGVSQATVREALNRLVLEGLATRVPHKGVRPIRVSREDLRDLYDIRASLEGLAVEVAAATMSAEDIQEMRRLLAQTKERDDARSSEAAREANYLFHSIPIAATRRKHLERILEQVWQLIGPYMRIAYGRSWAPGRSREERAEKLTQDFEDHAAIVAALEQGDGRQARRALNAHVFREYSILDALIGAEHEQ
jgi:DNA-binding GntR family transcriptional regulator